MIVVDYYRRVEVLGSSVMSHKKRPPCWLAERPDSNAIVVVAYAWLAMPSAETHEAWKPKGTRAGMMTRATGPAA